MALTFLYCGHRFWAEMYFEQYGDWAPFYFKVNLVIQFVIFATTELIEYIFFKICMNFTGIHNFYNNGSIGKLAMYAVI